MEPHPNSPSSSTNVLRFWEEPIFDHAVFATQNIKPLLPPSSSSSSHDYSSCWDADAAMTTNTATATLNNGWIPFAAETQTVKGDSVPHDPSPNFNPHDQPNCSHCQVLREVIHSNGIDITKLEIHGTLGVIYHAIVEVVQYGSTGAEVNIGRQLIDFSMSSLAYVKQYLLEYGEMRVREGFTPIQDSISAFYDALCTGMTTGYSFFDSTSSLQPLHQPDSDGGRNGQDTAMGCNAIFSDADAVLIDQMGSVTLEPSTQPPQTILNTSAPAISLPQMAEQAGKERREDNSERKVSKSGIAVQRERTRKLKLKDLMGHFHLPIQVAAKKLSVCSTVLKKICRRNGLRRWPYRKVKSLDRRIRELQKSVRDANDRGCESVRVEIEQLRQERAHICAGMLPIP